MCTSRKFKEKIINKTFTSVFGQYKPGKNAISNSYFLTYNDLIFFSQSLYHAEAKVRMESKAFRGINEIVHENEDIKSETSRIFEMKSNAEPVEASSRGDRG